MNIRSTLTITAFFAAGLYLNAQGTFLFDQQSSTDETAPPFGSGLLLPYQTSLPGDGQSFSPTLTSVGFIRLMFDDATPGDGLGASVFVNIRSGSITGSIIGVSGSVSMLDGFRGPMTFTFGSGVPVVPNTSYFFEPVEIPSGPPNFANGPWNVAVGQYNYSGGTAFLNGTANGAQDFWFREGVVVPEPSSVALLLAGAALFVVRRKRHLG